MTLKKYLFLMIFCTLLCLLALLFVIFFINPEEGGWLGLVFFYFSLFLTLVGLFAITGLLLRIKFKFKEIVDEEIIISFRQALLFSLLLVGALFLQSYSWLTWWNALIFVATLAVIEFFFSSYDFKNLKT